MLSVRPHNALSQSQVKMPSYRLSPFPSQLRADTQSFFNVLNDEGDFAAIVVTAAYLDTCVAALLRTKMRPGETTGRLLDAGRGALGSFAARADLAYALRLIEKPMLADLMTYARIRNMIAHHHLTFSFASPEIETACKELRYLLTMKNGDLDEMVFTEATLPPTRERYKFTAVYICNELLSMAEQVGESSAA